jgi:hypothetical protein
MKQNLGSVMAAIALSTLVIGTACAGRQTTTDASPATPAPAAAPTAPAPPQRETAPDLSGTFVSAEHPTTGTIRTLEENGRRYLEFEADFETDPGPDLVVVLHRAGDVLATTSGPDYPLQEGDYVELGALQMTQGTQRYAIPTSLNPADYGSVAVWCRRFNATFGAASLQ